MYRGSAHIVLGRWLDVDDYMYVENLAVGEKQRPPFGNVLGGDEPLFVIRPRARST